ncbi:hypothetical protein BJY01DRAFT_231176 [Aspergillus pseudoustus]|uniref:CobW/HypB/UreG nucleotide-binding domain-containing protein n=1 Tax=Aspergillus pseudoustus TaxID=1810923 RepID=A0ABR4KY31_9EURO
MSFPYKHILIIGATSGIGRAVAERLVENGAKVIVVGRRKDRLDEFVAKHGEDKASSIVFDISQLDMIPQFAKDVIAKHPDLDSVWLNAGLQRQYNLASDDWDFESFQNEFHVNVFSIVALARAFLPHLKEKAETAPASLIFTGTNLSVVPFAWAPGYCASKSALNVYTISIREQLKGKSNLKVIEVMPPAVQTELHDYMGEKGATLGMPIKQFTDEAFKGLQAGQDQVVVGHIEPREVFFDILEKKRKEPTTMAPIPITIVTGFLGSGKTTLLLNLLPQLPKNYKLALLKNEFGDVAIDSQLASTSAISGVRELLNGCICCNLVGQLSDALTQLRTEINPPPDRIIIETSGSAFPATLAMEVNRLARESPKGEGYILDGVVSVIDVENWQGYEDTSYTAKIQARYTDLIVFNKWEAAGERRFDEVLDRVGDLGIETAWVKSDKGRVEKDVLLGIDGALVAKEGVVLDGVDGEGHEHEHEHEHKHKHDHQSEVEVLSLTLRTGPDEANGALDIAALERLLSTASKEEVYRIKGILRTSTRTPPATSSDNLDERPAAGDGEAKAAYYILNWAFGRWTCTPSESVAEASDPTVLARITLILARYESAKWKKKLEARGLVRGHGGVGELSVERLA